MDKAAPRLYDYSVMQQDPAGRSRLSYATPRPPRPLWVRTGLYGLPSRASAWVFFWICIAIAAFSAVRALGDPRWWWGVSIVLAAAWYWASIRWVDRYDSWH